MPRPAAWAELAVVPLLAARVEDLLSVGKLIPNLIAGTLSGVVAAYVVRALLQKCSPSPPDVREAEEGTPDN
jgi:hypothetical protein